MTGASGPAGTRVRRRFAVEDGVWGPTLPLRRAGGDVGALLTECGRARCAVHGRWAEPFNPADRVANGDRNGVTDSMAVAVAEG